MANMPAQHDSRSVFVKGWAMFGRSVGDVVSGSTYTCPPKRAAIIDGWVTHKDNTLQSQVAMEFGRGGDWMEIEESYYYYQMEDHRQKVFLQAGDQISIVASVVTDQTATFDMFYSILEFGPQVIRAS